MKKYLIKKSICSLFPCNKKHIKHVPQYLNMCCRNKRIIIIFFYRHFLGQTVCVSGAQGLTGSRQDETNGGVIERQTTKDDSRPDGNAPAPLPDPPTLPLPTLHTTIKMVSPPSCNWTGDGELRVQSPPPNLWSPSARYAAMN